MRLLRRFCRCSERVSEAVVCTGQQWGQMCFCSSEEESRMLMPDVLKRGLRVQSAEPLVARGMTLSAGQAILGRL